MMISDRSVVGVRSKATLAFSFVFAFAVAVPFLLFPTTAAAQDTCASAFPISPMSLPTSMPGFTTGMTDDYQVPGLPSAGPDIVYSLTPTASGLFHFDLKASWNAVFFIATNCADIAGTLVGSVDAMGNLGSDYSEHLDVLLTNGVTYYLIVDGATPSDVGSTLLGVASAPWENSANPHPIPTVLPAFTDSGTTAGRVNDYNLGAVCGLAGVPIGPDVAWSFTPGETTTYRIEVTNDQVPAYLAISSDGGATCIPGGAWEINGIFPIGAPFVATIPLTKGMPYLVVLDTGPASANLVYTLRVGFDGPATGQTCPAAVSLDTPTDNPLTVTGDSSLPGFSNGLQDGACTTTIPSFAEGANVVYGFTAVTSRARFRATTSFDAVLYAPDPCPISGTAPLEVAACLAATNELGDAGIETLTLSGLTPSTSYRVVVDGSGPSDDGTFVLTYEKLPDNDTCASATVVPGNSGSWSLATFTTFGENDYTATGTGCTTAFPSGTPGPDVVFEVTPAAPTTPREFHITVDPEGFDFDPAVYVSTSCVSPIGSCASAANQSGPGGTESLSVVLTNGSPFRIFVDSVQSSLPSSAGSFAITIDSWIAGDTCTAPIGVTMFPASGTLSTSAAWNDYATAAGVPMPGPDLVLSVNSLGSTPLAFVAEPDFDVALVRGDGDVPDCPATWTGATVSDGTTGCGQRERVVFSSGFLDPFTSPWLVDSPTGGSGTVAWRIGEVPTNDVPLGASPLYLPNNPPAAIAFSGNLDFAGDDFGDPMVSCGAANVLFAGADLYFSFEPQEPGSARYRFDVTSAAFDVALAVVEAGSGTCVGAIDAVAGAGAESLQLNLTFGNDYYLVVDSADCAADGAFTGTVDLVAPNDTCAAATTILISLDDPVFEAYGRIESANPDFTGTTSDCPDAGDDDLAAPGPDVVFAWPVGPSFHGKTFYASLGSEFDGILYASTTCPTTPPAAAPTGCLDASSTGAGRGEWITVVPAQGIPTIFFTVDSTAGSSGLYYFRLEPAYEPGDNCSNPIPIETSTLGIPYTSPNPIDTSLYWNEFATEENCAGLETGAGPDVVHRLVVSRSGRYRVRAVPSGSFDPILYAYADADAVCSESSAGSVKRCVAYSDAAGDGAPEELLLDLTAGEATDLVLDSALATETGTFTLSVTLDGEIEVAAWATDTADPADPNRYVAHPGTVTFLDLGVTNRDPASARRITQVRLVSLNPLVVLDADIIDLSGAPLDLGIGAAGAPDPDDPDYPFNLPRGVLAFSVSQAAGCGTRADFRVEISCENPAHDSVDFVSVPLGTISASSFVRQPARVTPSLGLALSTAEWSADGDLLTVWSDSSGIRAHLTDRFGNKLVNAPASVTSSATRGLAVHSRGEYFGTEYGIASAGTAAMGEQVGFGRISPPGFSPTFSTFGTNRIAIEPYGLRNGNYRTIDFAFGQRLVFGNPMPTVLVAWTGDWETSPETGWPLKVAYCDSIGCGTPAVKTVTIGLDAITNVDVAWDGVGWVVAWDEGRPSGGDGKIHRFVTFLDPTGNELPGARVELAADGPLAPFDPRQRTSMAWDGQTYAFAWSFGADVWFARLHSSGTFAIEPGVEPVVVATEAGGVRPRFVDLSWVPARGHYRITWTTADAFGRVRTLTVRPDGTVEPTEVITDVSGDEFGHSSIRPQAVGDRELVTWSGGTGGFDLVARMSIVDRFTPHSLVNSWAGAEWNVTKGFAPSSPLEMDAAQDGERIAVAFAGSDGLLHFWKLDPNGGQIDCDNLNSTLAGTMASSNALVGPEVAVRGTTCLSNALAVSTNTPDGNGRGRPSSWSWADAASLPATVVDAGSPVSPEADSGANSVDLAAGSSPTSPYAMAFLRQASPEATDVQVAVHRLDASGAPIGGSIVVSTNGSLNEPASSPSIAWAESALLGYSGRFAVAWVDRRNGGAWTNPSLGFAFVAPDGSVTGESPLLPLNAGTLNPEVRIGWNGTEFGLLFKQSIPVPGGLVDAVTFARASRDGALIPGSSVRIDEGDAADLDLSWTGSLWAVSWVNVGPYGRQVRMTELSRFGEVLATPWQVPTGQGQDAAPRLFWFGDSYRALWMSDVGFRDLFMTRIEKPSSGIVCATVNTRPYPDLSILGATGNCDIDDALTVDLLVPRAGTTVTLSGAQSTSGSDYLACAGTKDAPRDDPGGLVTRYEWELNSDVEPDLFEHEATSSDWTVNWNTLSDNGMTLPGTYKVWLRVTDNTEGRPDLSPPGASSASSQTRSIDLTLVDITPPNVTVASPNGGETFVVGTSRLISWTASDDVDVDHVEIHLCTDWTAGSCGGAWTLLATVPAPATNWTWAIPGGFTPSARCRIKVVAYDTAAPTCTFPAACDDWNGDDSAANFYVVAANPESVRTLVVWNSAQFSLVHGAPASAETAVKLGELANNARVVGTIVDLADDVAISALYATWNGAGRTDNAAGNALAAAIRAKLHAAGSGLIPTTYTGTRWIVLVGDDRIVPSVRIPDATGIMPEQKYGQAPLNEIDCSTSEGSAICANFFLSDAPYADAVAEVASGVTFHLPDFGLGRLVETPEEIAKVIDTFIARDGQGPLTRALSTGYDFLDDAGVSIRNRFQARPSITTTSLLQSVDGNYAAAALQGLLLTTPHPDATFFGGHANHYTFGCPAGGLDATTLDGDADPLTGGVVFSVGCHSGLHVTTSNGSYHPLDLPQVLARKGVVAYLAPTGFGWGFTQGIGLTERVVDLYAQQLLAGGTVEVGTAWIEAKRRYFLEQTEVDVFDKKVLEEWGILGLPMYRLAGPASITEGATPEPFAGDGATRSEWKGITITKSLDDGTKGAMPNGSLPDGLTQLSLSFAFSSTSFAPVSTPAGAYYRLNGEATGEIGLPLQPKFTYDSRLSGVRLHGSLWLGGSYRPATLLADDGFESGTFGPLWENGSIVPWATAAGAPYRGLLSAKSGAVADGAQSNLAANVTLAAGGRVSFARRVSSEPGGDFLEFRIDGALRDAWSGEVAWGEVSYPVTAGAHTLTWRWVKNGSGSGGSDAAWIDVVRVDDDPAVDPVMGVPQNSETTPRGEPTPFIRGSTPMATGLEPAPTGCSAPTSRWDSLTVVTGFSEEPSPASFRQRLYDSYDVASFYSNSCDVTPPSFVDPGPGGFATVSGTTATFSVEVSDAGSGVYRVVVVANDGLSVPKAWKPLELTFDAASDRWIGTLPFRSPTPYVVQAVDSAGNVAPFTETVTDTENVTGDSWGTTTTVPKSFLLSFADADADGLADGWEAQYGVTNPASDDDTDLLTNLEEFLAGTIPTNPDTDGGGDNDGSEFSHGRSPLAAGDDLNLSLMVTTTNGGVDLSLDWSGSANAAIDGPFWVYRSTGDPFFSTAELLSSPAMPLGNGTRLLVDPGRGNDGNTYYYLVRNVPFAYPPPAIAVVTPSSGGAAGGTPVTIYGDEFRSGATVLFGTTPAGSVAVVNGSKITCIAPPHAVGTVDVTVLNTDEQAATKIGAFTFN